VLDQLEQDIKAISRDNKDFMNDGVFRHRLNTNEIFKEIEIFLTGVQIDYYQDENGDYKIIERKVGLPKANPHGVQAILQMIRANFNNQTVQGNLSNDRYESIITEVHYSLIDLIFANQYTFDIMDDDTQAIIDQIMFLVQLFISRTIDDGERNSYAQTLKTVESNSIKETNKFKIPFANN